MTMKTLKQFILEDSKAWTVPATFKGAQSIADYIARYSPSLEACVAVKQANDLSHILSGEDYGRIVCEALALHKAAMQ